MLLHRSSDAVFGDVNGIRNMPFILELNFESKTNLKLDNAGHLLHHRVAFQGGSHRKNMLKVFLLSTQCSRDLNR